MVSDARRIRSSAARTRLSRATSTGTTTTNRTALPIHHRFMWSSSTRVGLVGQEEAAQHPAERHPHRPQTDREAARRGGPAELVGRETAVERVDAGLHV